MASSPPRPNKRAKAPPTSAVASSSKQTTPARTARLFAPFRALGFITTALPLAVQARASARQTQGPKVTIVSSLGSSWAMWDGDKMGLLFVGPSLGREIRALAVKFDSVLAAVGPHVVRFERGKEVDRFTAPSADSVITQLLIFGTQLLALTEAGNELLIFNLETTELSTSIPLPADFVATHLIHPQTYLNKVVLASASGTLALYNIRTRTLLYTFDAPPAVGLSPAAGAVTAVAQSPAIDVIAVGYASGLVRLLDLRLDEEILSLRMEGAVSALGFRTDGEPILATASEDGDLALWDLNARGRLVHLVRTAHEGGVSTVEWIAGQSLLVTSGSDNAIRQWTFETPLSPPSLLKFREGHRAPPCLIRYYGEDGKAILTAGVDRALRMTSVVRDSRSREISQGSKKQHLLSSSESLKLPPITALSSSTARSKDWSDILSAHQPSANSAIGTKGAQNHLARTWSGRDCKVGRFSLTAPGGKADVASAVCVTACGNFGLVGGAKGKVSMWNLQSGLERKSFVLPSQAKIVGIATDSLNRVLVAAGADGLVEFFDFHSTQHLHSLGLPPTPESPSGGTVSAIALQRDSNLLAVSCANPHRVLLVDIETRRVVRDLRGFPSRILDLAFSPDSRWVIVASIDSVVRTFDVPSGSLVDAFRTESIPTSLAFSPTGDFLATAHADSVGVYLWANKAQFSEVALRAIEEGEVGEIAMPTVQGLEDDDELEGVEDVGAPEQKDLYLTPDQLSGELLTLSLLPRSKWQTLLNLEVIKARNKPKEAPKAPEQAPFFLPSLQNDSQPQPRVSLADQLGVNGEGQESAAGKKDSHRFMDSSFSLETEFTRRLTSENVDGDFDAFFTHLKSLSPSATDLELRSSLVSLDHLAAFIHALTQRLKSHRDFEAVQAFLAVFLRIHGDVLVQNGEELREPLSALRAEQVREGARLGELCAFSSGVLSFVRNVQA